MVNGEGAANALKTLASRKACAHLLRLSRNSRRWNASGASCV